MTARSAVEQAERVIDPARQGISHEPEPFDISSQHPPIPLEEALHEVDGWKNGWGPFRLHQIARSLREALGKEAATSKVRAEIIKTLQGFLDIRTKEAADLQRTFDLRWDADQRAIKRWQEASPGHELTWPDHADMVVWLLEESSALRDANECWQRFADRAAAAIPCSRGEEGECGLPEYPWAPCCNLRAAAWLGEPFPTDYLPDEGMIHLFEPPDPTCPDAPRRSAGCVRLIQPRTVEERYCGLPAFHTGP